MDYVPAHGNTNNLQDREDVSGVRVLDGEDQGKLILNTLYSVLTENLIFPVGYGNRLRMQQLQQKDWIDQQVKERQMFKE